MHKTQQGQTLVILLFFMVLSITITTAAVLMNFANAQSTTTLVQGNDAYTIADSGMENALLRLLRNPGYTGETLTVGSGTAVSTVTGVGTQASPFTVTAKGTSVNNFVRTIQTTAYFDSNNAFIVGQEKELF